MTIYARQLHEAFFKQELLQYDLDHLQQEYIREQMFDGLEILTRKEITKCIEDHIASRNW